MKKKLFMVISTISVITGLFILTGNNKVRADESGDNSCATMTNYYMFLDAVESNWFSEDWCTTHPNATTCASGVKRFDSKGYYLNTKKDFNLGVNGNVLDEGIEKMSASEFYKIYKTLTDNEAKTYGNDETKLYIRAEKWYNSTENESIGNVPLSMSESEFVSSVNNASNVDIRMLYNANGASASIDRTWNLNDAEKIYNKKLSISFSPYVYYVTYSNCGGVVTINHMDDDTNKKIDSVEDKIITGNKDDKWSYSCPNVDGYNLVVEGDKKDSYSGVITDSPQTFTCHYSKNAGFKVTVKYLEKGTEKELAKSEVVKSGLKDKDKYELTCKNNITKYDLVTTDKQTITINGKDAEAVCYYEKKSYTLTINYGDDEECTNPLKSADTYSKKWGETTKVEPASKIGSMTLTGLGTYTSLINPAPKYNNGVISFTMPENNASICVVYTPQTGSSIGNVMIIGAIALGGTMFFIKRNRDESEIEV